MSETPCTVAQFMKSLESHQFSPLRNVNICIETLKKQKNYTTAIKLIFKTPTPFKKKNNQ